MIRAARLAKIGFLKGRSSAYCSHCSGYRRCRRLPGAKSAIDRGGQSRRYIPDVALDFLSLWSDLTRLGASGFLTYCDASRPDLAAPDHV